MLTLKVRYKFNLPLNKRSLNCCFFFINSIVYCELIFTPTPTHYRGKGIDGNICFKNTNFRIWIILTIALYAPNMPKPCTKTLSGLLQGAGGFKYKIVSNRIRYFSLSVLCRKGTIQELHL